MALKNYIITIVDIETHFEIVIHLKALCLYFKVDRLSWIMVIENTEDLVKVEVDIGLLMVPMQDIMILMEGTYCY